MDTAPSLRRHLVPALLVGAALVASAIESPRLPAIVVTHWDLHGTPNGYGSRLFATLFMPALMVVVGVVLVAVRSAAPGRDATYARVTTISLAAMLGMHLLLLGVGTSLVAPARVPRLVVVLLSLLFVGLGNYMPRVTDRNPFLGIRFPWAYASDEVWRRTQRVGGYGMVAVGVIGLAAAAVASPDRAVPVLVAAVLVYLVALGVYSYRLARRADAS